MKKFILTIFIFIICLTTCSNIVFAENETGLSIHNVDVFVGSASDADVDNDTKINKEAKPSDIVKFSIEVENLFDSDTNCDDDNSEDKNECEIEDIIISVTIKGIDDEDDIESKTVSFTLGEGDQKTSELSFNIPEIVKSDIYDVIINVEGDNVGNNSKYSIEWILQLEVTKKKNDIIITNYGLNPLSLACGQTKSVLHIELLNQGTSDEDAVVIEVKNSNINMNERLTGINMATDYDKDARYSTDIPLEIGKEFLKEGIFPLTINVYYDTDKLDDQKTVSLEIKSCNASAPVQQTPVVEENLTEENSTNQTITEQVVEVSTENFLTQIPGVAYENINKFRASYYAIPLLAVFIIIGIIFLIKEVKKN